MCHQKELPKYGSHNSSVGSNVVIPCYIPQDLFRFHFLISNHCFALQSLKDVDGLQRRTEALFKQLLKKWPRSVKLLRAYGTFVEEVKQDALTAQRFFKEVCCVTENSHQR